MYIIDESLRKEFRKVIGKLVRDEKELFEELKSRKLVVSIGDMVTYTLLKNDFFPNLAIVDFRHRRRDIDHQMKRTIESFGDEKIYAKNPPSTITADLIDSIKKGYSASKGKKVLIIVEGEEDLSSLPAILLAPEGVTIIYGLPDRGIVLIDVTEKEKELVRNVLKRCEKHGAGDT